MCQSIPFRHICSKFIWSETNSLKFGRAAYQRAEQATRELEHRRALKMLLVETSDKVGLRSHFLFIVLCVLAMGRHFMGP